MSTKTNRPETDDNEGWEEKSQDNGDLIAWKAGDTHQGIYLGTQTVILPVSDQNPDVGDGSGGTAEMLVFENLTGRWSSWMSYQLREAFEDIEEGTEVRIKCTGERKAKVGNVKIFSVMTRTAKEYNVQQEAF